MYTSKECSQQLQEWGCNIESDFVNYDGQILAKTPMIFSQALTDQKECYPAYDLLWDICIKYAKEFFGEDNCKECGGYGRMTMDNPCDKCCGSGRITISIVSMLQQNKNQDEIEAYILENTIYNPKNK